MSPFLWFLLGLGVGIILTVILALLMLHMGANAYERRSTRNHRSVG